jgi:flagellar biosynthesis protein FlhA
VNAARLLGRVEVQSLVEHVTKLAPKLIEDVVPKMVGIATLQKVLQLLLEEGVHIRDMRSHRRMPGRARGQQQRCRRAGARIRVHLAPAIVQQIYGAVKELDVIALDPELERLVTQALNSPHGAALDPGVADTLTRQRRRHRARRRTWACRPACWCPT